MVFLDPGFPGTVPYLASIHPGLSLGTAVYKNAFITSKFKEYSLFFCAFPNTTVLFIKWLNNSVTGII